MTENTASNYWATARKLQFESKAEECWLGLAKLVTDSSFSTEKNSNVSRLPFETWWQSCFQLLGPFQVKISDIHYKGDEESPEYIELVNSGPAIVDVSGWVIYAGDKHQEYVFPQGSLMQSGEVIKVYTGGAHELTFGFDKQQIWNNKGEVGQLLNSDGELVCAWAYGNALHDCVEIVHIEFDGAEARTEGDEYVEISNSGDFWADVSGWQLASEHNQPFTFGEKSVIPPGGTVRVYTNQTHAESGGYSFNSATAIWNNKGDKGTLSDSTGKTVSEFQY